MGTLTAAKVKSLTKPGMHGDGEGLYLSVSRSGSRSWVQRISIDGRRREIGLGSFWVVSLIGKLQPGERAVRVDLIRHSGEHRNRLN